VRVAPKLITLASALALAGCGGGSGGETSSTSPFPTADQSTRRGCAFLTVTDVARASGASVRREDLAPVPEIVCSSAYVGAAGIVATVSELRGGLGALRRLRTAKSEELGSRTVERLPALGRGAFVARKRYLAFRRGERVIVLETGYGRQGELLLTVLELTRLAGLVSERL
jgi:hypothetical protein